MDFDLENLITKCMLMIGTPSGILGMTLVDVDLRFAILLKLISIISFVIIIIINLEQFFCKLKKYYQTTIKFFTHKKRKKHETL